MTRFKHENAGVYRRNQRVDVSLRLMNGLLVLRVATHISGDYGMPEVSCVRRSVYVRYAGVSPVGQQLDSSRYLAV